MSLFVASLNSGSNGNCYYIANENEAILVDAGIACREIEIRMKRLGLDIEKLKAIFVSHEHVDHTKGLDVFSSKHKLPVYVSAQMIQKGGLRLDHHQVSYFQSYCNINIGHLEVVAFPKKHDACDPYSFMVSCNKINVGIFTDLGEICENVIRHFSICHAAFLEANYDEEMLERGHYPYFLKQRIKGKLGHLSNGQALDLFRKHKASFMSHLIISHLSADNNCPGKVSELFLKHADKVKIIIASRYKESPVYHISGGDADNYMTREKKAVAQQLALLF